MNDDNDNNIVDIEKHRKKVQPSEDSTLDVVLNMSDSIDDVLESYLNMGIEFELVASVLANRLGALILAGITAGAQDITDLCVDIMLREASLNGEEPPK